MGDHLGDQKWFRALLGGPATDFIRLSLNEKLREPIPGIEKVIVDSARDVGRCPAPMCRELSVAIADRLSVGDRTGPVVPCDPNNPTGSRWRTKELRRFLDGLRGDVTMVLDEAYGVFGLGWEVLRSHANFLWLPGWLPGAGEPLVTFLAERGVRARQVAGLGMRISVGTAEQKRRLREAAAGFPV